jgi:hypothetical protein
MADIKIPCDLNDLRGAIRHQQENCHDEQDQAHGPREQRGQHLTAVLFVKLRTGSELALILGRRAVFAIPPRTTAIQIGANFRGTDGSHAQSIAQIF